MNIRYIKNQICGNSVNGSNHWVELQAYDGDGINVALNSKVYTNVTANVLALESSTTETVVVDGYTNSITGQFLGTSTTLVPQYIMIDLGSVMFIDFMQLWHYYTDGRSYKDNVITVSTDGVNWVTLFNSNIDGVYVETANGKTIIPNNTASSALISTYDNNHIEFSIYSGSNVVYKVEVLVNGVVKQLYTSWVDNLMFIYNVDESYRVGDNDIVIRLTYSNALNTRAVSEKWMTFTYNPVSLSDDSVIHDFNDRLEILANTVKLDKSILRESLQYLGKDVDSMSSMTSLVDNIVGITSIKSNDVYMPDWYCVKNSWITGATGPLVYMHTTQTYDHCIYCIGGFYNGVYMNYNKQYNTLTNTWIDKALLPTARKDLESAIVADNIYCIGGSNNAVASPIYLQLNQCYNITSNTWSTKANMTSVREGLGVGAVGDNIYCIGGYTGTYLKMNECYNITSNTWSTKANMITARCDFSACVVGTSIYCMGGSNGTYLGNNECYNTITNTWSTKTNMITPRSKLGACVKGTSIYCIGGFNAAILATNECYDTITDTWSIKMSLPLARSVHTAAIVDDIVYIHGGSSTSSTWTDVNACYII